VGSKKKVPSRNARVRRDHGIRILFFSLLSSCHVLGGTSPVCWLASRPPGIRWPYRRTCGFFARHGCGSKLIPPPALSVSMVVFLSYLAESSGISRIAHDVPLRAVSIVLNCFFPSTYEQFRRLINYLLVDRDYWLVVGICRAAPTSDHRRFASGWYFLLSLGILAASGRQLLTTSSCPTVSYIDIPLSLFDITAYFRIISWIL
jgi:hypothetical protein